MPGERRDHWTYLDAGGPLGGQREGCPTVESVAFAYAEHGRQVVRAPQGGEPKTLSVVAQRPPTIPSKAFLAFDQYSYPCHPPTADVAP